MRKIKADNLNPPVITNAFAADKGHYGHIWKIYTEWNSMSVYYRKLLILTCGRINFYSKFKPAKAGRRLARLWKFHSPYYG